MPTPIEPCIPSRGRAAAAPPVSPPEAPAAPTGPSPGLARLHGVRRRRGAVQALDGLDLELPAGQLTALLGVNGAGKTTAIEILLGLQPADAGQATLFGRSPLDPAAKARVGVMLQQTQLPERLRVAELLALVRSWYPAPRSVADCVAVAGLDGLLPRRYGRLSGGQQRRVQFALAVCGRPQLLILDEPTTGLDIEARQQVWRAIGALVASGTGVLLTTHYLEEAEALADRVVVLDAGRVCASGRVDAVCAQVAQRRIRCTTQVPPERVLGWPGVAAAERVDGRLVVLSECPEAVLRRLLDADPELADLDVRGAGLAEAFVAITAGADAASAARAREAA